MDFWRHGLYAACNVRVGLRHWLLGAVVVAALVTLGAGATLGASGLKITDCNRAGTRLRTVTLTCGDGNTLLRGLRWSSFGGAVARASGTFLTNTCEPNCAQGKVVRYQVQVKAGSSRSCKNGLRVYGKLTLKFGANVLPTLVAGFKRWTLRCPY